jgi:hypothetical protein
LRTTLMAASPLRAMVDFAQGTPLPWRKRDLVKLWDQILRKVAFADPSNLRSRAAFVIGAQRLEHLQMQSPRLSNLLAQMINASSSMMPIPITSTASARGS